MTIIVVQGRTMAADSFSFRGGVGYPCAQPKIVRAPDGSLVGSAGSFPDIDLLKKWVIDGMDWSKPPTFAYDKDNDDNSIDNLWLRSTGELLRFGPAMKPYAISNPATVGINDACTLAEGMMMAGRSVEMAVAAVCERCAYVGGPIQVERLAPPKTHQDPSLIPVGVSTSAWHDYVQSLTQ
jgi:hypothetical protein